MSLIFFDGMDYVPTGTSHLTSTWDVKRGFDQTFAEQGFVEFDRRHIGKSMYKTTQLTSLLKGLEANFSELIVGHAFYCVDFATVGLGRAWINSFSKKEERSVGLCTGPNGDISIYRNSATLLFGSDFKLRKNLWYFIECHVGFHNTTGFYELRVNNNALFNITNINTSLDNNNSCNEFRIGAPFHQAGAASESFESYYRDIYIIDPTDGIGITGFLGDCVAESLFPNANAGFSDFIGSDGDSVNNFELVNQRSIDGTSFVRTNTIGNKDLYNFTRLKYGTNKIHAIRPSSHAKKSDAGFRNLRPIVEVSGIEYTGELKYPSTDDWHHTHIFEKNPNTNNDWTLIELNDIVAGISLEGE